MYCNMQLNTENFNFVTETYVLLSNNLYRFLGNKNSFLIIKLNASSAKIFSKKWREN
jgi:hypothetical protein